MRRICEPLQVLRPPFSLWTLFLTPLLLNAGCQESDSQSPYAGTYEIRSHTKTTAGCSSDAAPVQGEAAYFSFEEETFFGIPLLTWFTCDSAESCSDVGELDRSFTKESGGWISQVIYASGGVECSVELIEGTIEETDSGVRLEFRSYEGSFTLASTDACETELAEDRRDELECAGIEVIEATLL
jgi:hypothetical protein